MLLWFCRKTTVGGKTCVWACHFDRHAHCYARALRHAGSALLSTASAISLSKVLRVPLNCLDWVPIRNDFVGSRCHDAVSGCGFASNMAYARMPESRNYLREEYEIGYLGLQVFIHRTTFRRRTALLEPIKNGAIAHTNLWVQHSPCRETLFGCAFTTYV